VAAGIASRSSSVHVSCCNGRKKTYTTLRRRGATVALLRRITLGRVAALLRGVIFAGRRTVAGLLVAVFDPGQIPNTSSEIPAFQVIYSTSTSIADAIKQWCDIRENRQSATGSDIEDKAGQRGNSRVGRVLVLLVRHGCGVGSGQWQEK
jgi:hypothetical protein